MMKIQDRYQKITIINIHAPIEEKSIEIKDFYSQIARICVRIPKYDVKIVLGDATAKIGREELYRPIIGHHSMHEMTNESGHFLVDFARKRNMVIKSTCFQQKETYKGTWKSPDRSTINQIDHALVERDMEKCVINMRTYTGLDVDSDHFMLGIKLKQIIPALGNQQNKKSNAKKSIRLRTEEDKTKYLRALTKELVNLTEDKNVEKVYG